MIYISLIGLHLHYGDMTDSSCLLNIVSKVSIISYSYTVCIFVRKIVTSDEFASDEGAARKVNCFSFFAHYI